MPTLFPIVDLVVAPLTAEGVQRTPPLCWPDSAARWADESGTSITGRYIPARGVAEGPARFLARDTSLAATAGRTGRAFTAVHGTFRDDYVHPRYGVHALLMEDGGPGVAFEALEAAPYSVTGLTHTLIVLRRGICAPGAAREPEEVNLYVELAYGAAECNYRMAFELGRPIRLQRRDAGGGEWRDVATASGVGDLEAFSARANGEVWFAVRPDPFTNVLWIELGDGVWLRDCPVRPDGGEPALPGIERLRVTGRNGWWTLCALPIRFDDLVVRRARQPLGPAGADAARASLQVNAQHVGNPAQTLNVETEPNGDGTLEWTLTAHVDDGGTGEGAPEPPTLSDVTLILPSVWTSAGGPGALPIGRPAVIEWEEREVLDEASRTISCSARLTLDNRWGQFAGEFGNYAFDLLGGLAAIATAPDGTPVMAGGTGLLPRMHGMLAGGIRLERRDPRRIVVATGYDAAYKLARPLGQELVLDGWCLYGAVHQLLDIGQVPPGMRRRIPYWAPGPAGYDCPYQILPRGSGAHAALRFPANASCLSVLLELVGMACELDAAGRALPFVMGQGYAGQFYFEPWNVRAKCPVAAFSDNDPGGWGQILELQVFNSVDDLRTSIDLMGEDPRTGEILWAHEELAWNLPAVGYRYPWLERNPAWVDAAFLERLMATAKRQASLPCQRVQLRAPYQPAVHAGDMVLIGESHTLGRSGAFIVTELRSRCSQPAGIAESVLVCRAAENMAAY